MSIHVLKEALGESLGSNLSDEHGEHNEVKISLNVVHNLGLEICLPVIGGDIECHLGLNDALSDVLNTSTTWRWGGQVNQFVNLRETTNQISLF